MIAAMADMLPIALISIVYIYCKVSYIYFLIGKIKMIYSLCITVDAFKVALDITIKIDIRSRSLNGVLFSVHGNKDFVLLQLVKGEVRPK